VNKELSTPLAPWTTSTTTANGLRSAGIILAGSALIAICSHVSLPLWFTPVPLTMQPFAVLLLGLLLAPRLASTTLAAYLIEGALGLPVFAPGFGFGAGMAHLLGPTGGYLLSYPFAALLISYFWRRTNRSFSTAIASAAVGNLVILTCGFLWMASFIRASTWTVLTFAVLPFLPGDALKVVAAAAIAAGLQRARRRKP
jgi:biotin transport system substrate-specific component